MSETEIERTDAPATAKGSTEVREMSQLQQSAARAVAESKAISPHAYFGTDIDLRASADFISEERGPALRDLLIRATAVVLSETPTLNAAYRDGKFELYSRVNVGFSVAARDSVVLPVIHDAGAKSLTEIADESRQLEARAQDGSITRPELAGATFTVTTAGIERFTPVITRGQAAALGAGHVHDAPLLAAGEVLAGARLCLSLACDARIVASAAAADFLGALKTRLQSADDL